MILEAIKKQSFTLSADSIIYIVYILKYIVKGVDFFLMKFQY